MAGRDGEDTGNEGAGLAGCWSKGLNAQGEDPGSGSGGGREAGDGSGGGLNARTGAMLLTYSSDDEDEDEGAGEDEDECEGDEISKIDFTGQGQQRQQRPT